MGAAVILGSLASLWVIVRGHALGEGAWTSPYCWAVLDRDGKAADHLRRLGLPAT